MPEEQAQTMPWDMLSPLGDGPVTARTMPEQVRRQRHHIRAIEAAQMAAIELTKQAIVDSAAARITADQTSAKITSLTTDLYGSVDRPDDIGDIGELKRRMRGLYAQGWAIILLLLGMLTGLIANLAIPHH